MPQVVTDYDDIAWAAGQKIEADAGKHTLTLDGRTVELLMCKEGLEDMARQLEPFFDAGQEVRKPGRRAGRKNAPRGGRKLAPEVIKLIAWVDEAGLRNKDNPDMPLYRGRTGKLNVTQRLWNMYYDAHPEERNGVGRDRSERWPADAGDRGR